MENNATQVILKAWRATCEAVIANPAAYVGREKEALVFRTLRDQIGLATCDTGAESASLQVGHGSRFIDVVWRHGVEQVAIEGKYKIQTDGAIPDNRKAAFFDLFKLERCVDDGPYTGGLFLWLTDQPKYLEEARGDSAEFSTHDGRVYRMGVPLRAARARDSMPIPLTLNRSYSFKWERLDRGWQALVIRVDQATQPNPKMEPTRR